MINRAILRLAGGFAVLALAIAFTLAGIADSQAGNRAKRHGWSSDVGGYSMNRREIFGLDEMPPPPRDFGPHFDYQPQPLDGGLSHAPYMH